jgi:hypothetical protein
MTRPPALTDRVALSRNRARARRMPAEFLHKVAADELLERLSEVNRVFTSPAIVTGHPEFWAEHWPNAKVVADDDVVALDPGAHDLIIHAMALHWASDPVGQLVQARRALQPDGLFLGVLFGGQTLAQLRIALAEAEAAVTGGLSPRVLPMAEIRDLGALLQRAGFALPVADTSTQSVHYRSIRHLAADLRGMGEGNALEHRSRLPSRRAVFDAAEVTYRQNFPAANDRIVASFEFIFLTGWAPADSQPKPLRPGSASRRLADVLGTDELPLPDRAILPRND